MGSMKDLLGDRPYPYSPGFKKEGTSKMAADSVGVSRSENLRARIVAALKVHGPMTADEAALHLKEDRLAIRPRFTELLKLRRIEETGERHQNVSGKNADVYRIKELPTLR